MTAHPNQTVLVIGHRNPDTDAICSALAYAHFYQWQTGRTTQPCYLDDLAPETTWLLSSLGLEPPRAVGDVYMRVSDVIETTIPVLYPDSTLREAGQLMQQHKVRALPVVDADHRLVGLVQSDTLANRYLDDLQLPQEIDLPVSLLARTLEAELLSGQRDAVLNDQVWIATMSADTVPTRVGSGDIVIVGNQPGVQQAALAAGAGCLILTDNAPIAAELQAAATQHGTLLLRTHHSPFAAALLLQQSIPVGRTMMRDLDAVSVSHNMLLRDARAHLRRSNLTGLAVIDDDGKLLGILLRRNLTEQASRQVVLTDHNHPEQAAPGVSESQIVAIIDHHNLGGLQTLQPLFMHCEPVGSTCTLIGELYRQTGAPLPAALAGAMLGAVLSDTVQFRSPTTTERDRVIAGWLSERSGQLIDSLARGMFRARLPDPIPPPKWWVNRDMKVFSFGDVRFSISQVELTNVSDVMPPAGELRRALADLVLKQSLTSAFILLTDIFAQGSILLAANAEGEALAERAFGGRFHNGQLDLPGVMSRKKQVVPPLAAAVG